MTSKALWGGAIALAIAVVMAIGIWVGSAIASRRSADAAAAAVATYVAQSPPPGKPALGQPAARPGLTTNGEELPRRPAVTGVVLDATGDEVTVKLPRGPTARVLVGPNTVVRRRGRIIAVGDLKPGDSIVAIGRPNQRDRTLQAAVIVVDPPRPLRAIREALPPRN